MKASTNTLVYKPFKTRLSKSSPTLAEKNTMPRDEIPSRRASLSITVRGALLLGWNLRGRRIQFMSKMKRRKNPNQNN